MSASTEDKINFETWMTLSLSCEHPKAPAACPPDDGAAKWKLFFVQCKHCILLCTHHLVQFRNNALKDKYVTLVCGVCQDESPMVKGSFRIERL